MPFHANEVGLSPNFAVLNDHLHTHLQLSVAIAAGYRLSQLMQLGGQCLCIFKTFGQFSFLRGEGEGHYS